MNNTKIFETIIISQDVQGNPHVAPFGVKKITDGYMISPFRPSKSIDNFLTKQPITINFCDDVRVFAFAITKAPLTDFLEKKEDIWHIKECLAYERLHWQKMDDEAIRPHCYFVSQQSHNLRPFSGFNRAEHAIIELSILASRVDRIAFSEIQTAIERFEIIMHKTAGEKEWEAWHCLLEFLRERV